MIRYSEEFAKKDFKADTMKDAYMKAIKWYATNILSNDILKDVQVSYEKIDSENKPIVRMRLFAPLDESTLRRNHCEICKETHKSFYISEETNCNWCKIKAYQERMKNTIKQKRTAYRETLVGVIYGKD